MILLKTILGHKPALLALLLMAMECKLLGMTHQVRAVQEAGDISYIETTDVIANPGIGFYYPVCIHYKTEGNEINTFAPKLLHMRLDLSEFSGAYNQTGDRALSQDMLDAFAGTLENLRKKGCSAIIRFSYDPWFCGEKVYEPDINMIVKHIGQAGSVITEYQDVVVAVECGMFGKWGELHGSEMCKPEFFNPAIDAWLAALPENVSFSVRSPGHFCYWMNIDRSTLDTVITQPGEAAYRIGLYNDGYLGSGSDLGTYHDRAKELVWVERQAEHTLFGGELMNSGNEGSVKSTAEYMETEAFHTHTSYLNAEWNYTALESLKASPFEGKDERYHGQTDFTYVRNRLGYRFVVRDFRCTTETTAVENFGFEADIENVGFANLVRSKQMTVYLIGDDISLAYPLEQTDLERGEYAHMADARKWKAGEVSMLQVSLDLPDDLATGTYKVYLRIADRQERPEGESYPILLDRSEEEDETKTVPEGYPIRFANEGDNVWNEELGANYFGTFEVVEDDGALNQMIFDLR